MRKASARVKGQALCIIMPEDGWKVKWDMWVVIVLIFVAFTLPVRIAFYETDSTLWKCINLTIDSTFGIDVILTFFTALPDPENNDFITDKGKIARLYLKGWFPIDVISIIPLDKIFEKISASLAQLGKFGRFARFTRLIRLFRIVRMAKLLRICRDRKKLERAGSGTQMNPNIKRLLVFLVAMLLVNHTMACLWVMAARFEDENNWL